MNDLSQWRASIGFFKSPVNSVMLTVTRVLHVSSSASDVVLSNTVVTVIRDVAMLQMFMHVYVVANCTILLLPSL